jgi:hypothetical protein
VGQTARCGEGGTGPRRADGVLVVAVMVCALALAAPGAWAQAPRRTLDPQQLQEPRRAPLTLTPSLQVEAEYDDNVLLNNEDRRWDFITRFRPGLSLEAEDPRWRLGAAYSFSAEVYARNDHLNRAFDAHDLALDALWRATPHLALTLSDTFAFSTSTNLIAPEGVATGRDEAWSNTLAGAASWDVGRLTTLRGGASWTVQRFDREDLQNSDVWRGDVGADRALTPFLTGTLSYELASFDIDGEPQLTAHTPRVGIVYRFTETLTGTLNGGPTFEVTDDDTRITPAVRAGLHHRVAWGVLGMDYTRGVGTAGGLGGTTVNQSVGGIVQLITLRKGLTVELGPRYSIVESHDDRIDVRGLTLPLSATYRFTPWLALVASYTFFHQRSDSTVTTRAGIPVANDVDQNRLAVGLTLGYPIRFD